jgi:hypothetical protein
MINPILNFQVFSGSFEKMKIEILIYPKKNKDMYL